MEFVVKQGDIISLENDELYQVARTFEYNEKGYVYLIKVSNFDASHPAVAFATEDCEGEDYSLDILTDINEIGPVARQLKDLINKEVETKTNKTV